MPPAELCVIFNPASGRGRSARRVERLRESLASQAEFWPTSGPGDAEVLAEKAAQAGFRQVGAAGGDGTVHEVANGILRAGRPDTALAIFPVGSANDYAHSLGLDSDWWTRPEAMLGRRPVDVGIAQAPNGRQRYFINGIGLGFNCAVTIESRNLPWLQGVPLYLVALLQALRRRYVSPVTAVTLDETTRQGPTLACTVALGRREGNFVLAPDAQVDDGLFDYLLVGPLSRWRLLGYIPGMITGRLPTDDPLIARGRCQHVVIASETPLTAHVDGEFFCLPEDNLHRLEVRLLSRALTLVAPGAGKQV
jgi:diacylglycerol kinase family enzyme